MSIGQIAGAASGIAGALLGNTRRQQQYGDQVKLMEIQQRNQMELNKQGAQLARENWDYTNYENQVNHMENAGLNVGLMYGGSGAGGTLSSGSGGSASGGNAPTPENSLGLMGIGLQQMANQNALTKAQIENINADTNKKEVEANKLAGADTENTIANTALTKMNTENAELQNKLQSQSLETTLDTIIANRDKAVAESAIAMNNANVDLSTKEAKIKKINSEAINEAFKLTLMQSDTNLNNEKARAITQELAQEWERLSIELDKVGIGKMQNAIQEFTAKVNARLGTQNLQMRRIEAGLNTASSILKKGTNVDASGTRSTTINNY